MKKNDVEKKYIHISTKTVLYILIIIAIILFFIILSFFAKKLILFNNISNQLETYMNKNNYYIRIYDYQGWNSSTHEIWVNGQNMISKYDNDIICYINNGIVYDINNDKYSISNYTVDYMLQNNWEFIRDLKEKLDVPQSIFKYSLNNATVNGKKCFKLINENTILYFEQETGLLVRCEILDGFVTPSENEIQSTILDYKFEFDCVTDKDIELDISKLKLL